MLPTSWCGLLRSLPRSSHSRINLGALIFLNTRQASSAVHEIKDEDGDLIRYDEAKPFSSIPGPKGLPVIGTWLDYKLNPERIHRKHIYLKQLQAEYGDIVKERLAGETVVHLLSPEFIRQIYDNEGKHPVIPPLLPNVQHYRKERDMAPGLGNSNGDEWYQLRAVIQQILVRPQKALDYLYLQNEVADRFIDKIESLLNADGEVANLNQWVYRWGLETSFATFFDKRMGYLEESGMSEADKIISNNTDVFEISTKLWFSLPLYKYLPTPSLKKLFHCEDFINNTNMELFNQASKEFRDELEGRTKHGKKYLFLSYLLGSKTISAKEVMSVVNSVLTDTLSTTSQALQTNLYSLAVNPEAQEKAYREAVDLLRETGDLTAEGFKSSAYIKACMKENFRFYPVGLEVQRNCPTDMVIGGYQVPEGTYMSLDHYVPLHNPSYMPDPDSFLPERWIRGHDVYKKPHPFTLIPFSVGTRMCAGRRFAEQELVIMIAKILKRFRLEWHHEPLRQRHRILQTPDQPLKVKFIHRRA